MDVYTVYASSGITTAYDLKYKGITYNNAKYPICIKSLRKNLDNDKQNPRLSLYVSVHRRGSRMPGASSVLEHITSIVA